MLQNKTCCWTKHATRRNILELATLQLTKPRDHSISINSTSLAPAYNKIIVIYTSFNQSQESRQVKYDVIGWEKCRSLKVCHNVHFYVVAAEGTYMVSALLWKGFWTEFVHTRHGRFFQRHCSHFVTMTLCLLHM